MWRKNNKKIIFYIVLVLFIIYLVLEIFLPGIVEKEIKKEILKQTDEVGNLEIKANSFPAWELLFSKADQAELNADYIKYDGLRLEQVSSSYSNLVIGDNIIKGENTDLKILITETAINQYLASKDSSLENFKINLNPGLVFLEGVINFFNNKINIQLEGKFEVREEKQVFFIPGDVKIEKFTLSKDFIQSFIDDLGFKLSLEQLNFPLNIEEIQVENDKLYLLGGKFVRRAGIK